MVTRLKTPLDLGMLHVLKNTPGLSRNLSRLLQLWSPQAQVSRSGTIYRFSGQSVQFQIILRWNQVKFSGFSWVLLCGLFKPKTSWGTSRGKRGETGHRQRLNKNIFMNASVTKLQVFLLLWRECAPFLNCICQRYSTDVNIDRKPTKPYDRVLVRLKYGLSDKMCELAKFSF